MKTNTVELALQESPKLTGRGHVPRQDSWTGEFTSREGQTSLNAAGLLARAGRREYMPKWAAGLSLETVRQIARLRDAAKAHREQLRPAEQAKKRDTRPAFGRYLTTLGLAHVERCEVYERTAAGEATAAAVAEVLSARGRKEESLLPGQFWVVICCHRHYSKGSHALNSVHARRLSSWHEAQLYADSYHTGKHGWTLVEARYCDSACHTCGAVIPVGSGVCKSCLDAWPRVSQQEMRELEEWEAEGDEEAVA